MEKIDILKQIITKVSDNELNEVISKGALKLSNEQIATVSFVFWLVYMAETDLNTVISEAWSKSKQFFSKDVHQITRKMLQKMIPHGRKIDVENLEYFSDKIKIFEAMFGRTSRTELLYKLRDLRNDISHNRIDELRYNGGDLSLRTTKEKILLDYFEIALEVDFSKSDFWNSLTEDEKAQIEEIYRCASDNELKSN